MTSGHGQWCGDGLWEWGMEQNKGGQRGKTWDNCNRINKNKIEFKKRIPMYISDNTQ